MKKYIIIGVILLLLLIGGGIAYYKYTHRLPLLITEDTTYEGDYILPEGSTLLIQNGATFTVTGNLTANGNISCANGRLSLAVLGTLYANNKIECFLDDAKVKNGEVGIAIVAPHFLSGQFSILETNSGVDIVSDAKKLITDPHARKGAYLAVTNNTGAEARVGPFTAGNGVEKISELESDFDTAPTIDAGAPSLVLQGKWKISGNAGAQPENALVHFDLGDTGTIRLERFTLTGSDGNDGENSAGTICDARGGAGTDAGRFTATAKNITLDEFALELGSGGAGGSATTKTDCDNARAVGGNGGKPGNFSIRAKDRVFISRFYLTPGKSGNGGDATAYGKNAENACPGGNGGNAEAIGGNGADNKLFLSTGGTVTGLGKITIGRIESGAGGNGVALAGRGGDGSACGCAGGRGGNATATGGTGGGADGATPSGTIEAHGNDGGDASATGGEGGLGGNCELKSTGGNGGEGGAAKVILGTGGQGRTANGNDGSIRNTTGGNGGSGGGGCGPGIGGLGGLGTPIGKKGSDGKVSCGPGETYVGATPPKQTNEIPTGPELIKAILFHGKYLPVDQLVTKKAPGCPKEHWRAKDGEVVATDGSNVIDPVSAVCGYGMLVDTPVTMVPAKPYTIGQ